VADHATNTIEGQIAAREEMNRERFDYVLGSSPKMLSGKGKNYLLNYAGLKEAYDEAVKTCPIAADAIVALVWDAHHQMVTLLNLERDFRNKQ
jgi:predicted nucleotidyltransferase